LLRGWEISSSVVLFSSFSFLLNPLVFYLSFLFRRGSPPFPLDISLACPVYASFFFFRYRGKSFFFFRRVGLRRVAFFFPFPFVPAPAQFFFVFPFRLEFPVLRLLSFSVTSHVYVSILVPILQSLVVEDSRCPIETVGSKQDILPLFPFFPRFSVLPSFLLSPPLVDTQIPFSTSRGHFSYSPRKERDFLLEIPFSFFSPILLFLP